MELSIDRIEGEIAVCQTQDHKIIPILLSKIAGNAKEGDVIEETANGYAVSQAETIRRREAAFLLQESLFSDDKL